MLVLTRGIGEKIRIGEEIVVSLERTMGKQARIGVDAPPGVKILRDEIAAAGIDGNPCETPATPDWLTQLLGVAPANFDDWCYQWRPRAVATEFEFELRRETHLASWQQHSWLKVCVIPTLPPRLPVFVVQLQDPTQADAERLCKSLGITRRDG